MIRRLLTALLDRVVGRAPEVAHGLIEETSEPVPPVRHHQASPFARGSIGMSALIMLGESRTVILEDYPGFELASVDRLILNVAETGVGIVEDIKFGNVSLLASPEDMAAFGPKAKNYRLPGSLRLPGLTPATHVRVRVRLTGRVPQGRRAGDKYLLTASFQGPLAARHDHHDHHEAA